MKKTVLSGGFYNRFITLWKYLKHKDPLSLLSICRYTKLNMNIVCRCINTLELMGLINIFKHKGRYCVSLKKKKFNGISKKFPCGDDLNWVSGYVSKWIFDNTAFYIVTLKLKKK